MTGMGKLEAVQAVNELVRVEVLITKKTNRTGRGPSKADYKREESIAKKLYAALTGEAATEAEVREMVDL